MAQSQKIAGGIRPGSADMVSADQDSVEGNGLWNNKLRSSGGGGGGFLEVELPARLVDFEAVGGVFYPLGTSEDESPTVTLPLAASVTNGTGVGFRNTSETVSWDVTTSDGDTIDGASGGQEITTGTGITFISDGVSSWWTLAQTD